MQLRQISAHASNSWHKWPVATIRRVGVVQRAGYRGFFLCSAQPIVRSLSCDVGLRALRLLLCKLFLGCPLSFPPWCLFSLRPASFCWYWRLICGMSAKLSKSLFGATLIYFAKPPPLHCIVGYNLRVCHCNLEADEWTVQSVMAIDMFGSSWLKRLVIRCATPVIDNNHYLSDDTFTVFVLIQSRSWCWYIHVLNVDTFTIFLLIHSRSKCWYHHGRRVDTLHDPHGHWFWLEVARRAFYIRSNCCPNHTPYVIHFKKRPLSISGYCPKRFPPLCD